MALACRQPREVARLFSTSAAQKASLSKIRQGHNSDEYHLELVWRLFAAATALIETAHEAAIAGQSAALTASPLMGTQHMKAHMTSDDQDGDDPQQGGGDADKPTRDARGRWLPDYCPNPKGRPKKKPKGLCHVWTPPVLQGEN